MLPVSGDLTFELVAQMGGSVSGVAAAGEVAYVGVGPRVFAFDVSNPSFPAPIGQTEPLAGLPWEIIAMADQVFVGAGRALIRFDAANPGALIAEASVELPGNVGRIVLDGDVIYAGGSAQWPTLNSRHSQDGGFVAAIHSAFGEMQIGSAEIVPMPIGSVARVGETLYAAPAGERSRLFALTLASPTQIEAVHPLDLVGIWEMRNIWGYGSTLVINQGGIVGAYDVSDPLQPIEVWSSEPFQHVFLLPRRDDFYAFGTPGGAYTRDMQTPPDVISLPDVIAGETPASFSSNVVGAGDVILTASNSAMKIYTFDMVDGNEDFMGLEPLHQVTPEPALTSFAALGDVVYGIDNWRSDQELGRLIALSLPDLTEIGHYEPPDRSTDFYGVAVWGDHAYLNASKGGLTVFSLPEMEEVAALSGSELVGEDGVRLSDHPPTIFDGRLYMLVRHGGREMAVLDLALPTDPQPLVPAASDGRQRRCMG